MRPISRVLITLLASLSLCVLPGLVRADERAELEQLRDTISDMVEALVASGALSRVKADELIARSRTRSASASSGSRQAAAGAALAGGAAVAATAAPAPAPNMPGVRSEKPREPVRVQYVPEAGRRDITEQVKQEVLAQARSERWGEPGALPDWTERIRFEGDLRMRYQIDDFASGNAPASVLYDDRYFPGTNYADLTNSTEDRNRLRIRARFGVLAKISDEWSGAFRLSTGSNLGPVSTSSTSGDPSDRFSIKLDRAFLKWAPSNDFAFTAGRMPNPYFSSDMMFSTDLGFDGAALAGAYPVNDSLRLVGVGGAFMLKETSLGKDRWMSGLQAGVEWRPQPQWGMRLAVGRYDYHNVEGVIDDSNFGTPSYALSEYERGFRQKGNSLFRINDPVNDTAGATKWGEVSKFNVDALTFGFEAAHFDPVIVDFSGEIIRNRGFNLDEIRDRLRGGEITRGTSGQQYRIGVGNRTVAKRHDWQSSLTYRYVEKDATLDAFTDPECGLGGTNLRCVILAVNYGLDRNVALGFRWLSARQIEGPQFKIDTIQLDLTTRF